MRKIIEIFTLFLPFLLSILFAYNRAYMWGTVVVVCSMFLVVIFNPQCEGRENLWMFILTTISLLIFNFKLVNVLSDVLLGLYGFNSKFSKIVLFMTVYSIVFATQQILIACITRLLFRRQKKLL